MTTWIAGMPVLENSTKIQNEAQGYKRASGDAALGILS
jgi:hypothetical protein